MTGEPIAPEIFTTDFVGKPGNRRFFLQARGGTGSESYLLEKEQVMALAERLRDMLVLIDQADTIRSAIPARDPALNADEPDEAAWRVTTIGLGYEEDADRIIVVLQEGVETDPENVVEGAESTYLLRRDQVRAFVLHALAVVAEGRPICQLCGLPMDPEGHQCPASNGHHVSS
ncbi:MAG: DUF3090 domain-containing protein [Actinomycetota bacterium]|nr:DUF3090 domain-containing protein [Actinomycetota bacterium]